MLDFRDSFIEAKVMMELRAGIEQANAPGLLMQQTAVDIRENPQVASRISDQYPDLMSIIDDMNRDRSHLAN